MTSALHVGILAGEASGDILGADLMQSLQALHPQIRFSGIGGPLMQAQGLVSDKPMDRLSVMGYVEPLKRLPELLNIRRTLCERLQHERPDVFIGIDSPGFNMGLETKLKQAGIPVVHYVSPQIWAWRQKRILKIEKAVDLMLCLFPFEEQIYQKQGIPVVCTGHALADQMPLQNDSAGARHTLGLDQDAPVLAVLPGSRHSEVERLAPAFLDAALLCQQQQPQLQVIIPAANDLRRQQLIDLLQTRPALKAQITDGQARTVMAAADRILIASGTATLEALFCKKPMVVCYRMARLSYALISRMLKVPYFSLPNLLAEEKLVTELVQDQVNGPQLYSELQRLDSNRVKSLEQRFTQIHQTLKRGASDRAARAVLDLVASRQGEKP